MRPRYVQTRTDRLEQVQQDVQDFASQVGELSGGILLRDRAIGATETIIAHGLRSVPTGWQVVSPQADARIWQSRAPDSTYLYLQASAAVTCHLWVL